MGEDRDITQLLQAARGGDDAALNRVIAITYDELRRLAAVYMSRERRDHTLQPTALLNEACIRLLGAGSILWNDRKHFFACAAQQMRRILVDHARARHAAKRGGEELVRVGELAAATPTALTSVQLLALNDALEALSREDPRQGRVVELRYFGGFSEEEIADILNVAVRTVRRDWAHAKATLARTLGGGGARHARA
jgi:RNA polymerase sigma-70 factor (ECF subfamily)